MPGTNSLPAVSTTRRLLRPTESTAACSPSRSATLSRRSTVPSSFSSLAPRSSIGIRICEARTRSASFSMTLIKW